MNIIINELHPFGVGWVGAVWIGNESRLDSIFLSFPGIYGI